MGWKVDFDGEVLTSEDFTLEEMAAIEKASDVSWYLLNPFAKAEVAIGALAVVLVRHGMDDAAARAKIGKLTGREIRDVFSFWDDESDLPQNYEAGLPDPKAAPEVTWTTGSYGPSTTSDGPQTPPEPTPSET